MNVFATAVFCGTFYAEFIRPVFVVIANELLRKGSANLG